MSEIANDRSSNIGLENYIRRFLSAFRNYCISCRTDHDTHGRRRFLTERRALWIFAAILLLVVPVADAVIYSSNIEIAEDYGTFVEGVRDGHKLDICRYVVSADYFSTKDHADKREPTGPSDDPSDPELVQSSPHPPVCHVGNDNLLHQGVCTIYHKPGLSYLGEFTITQAFSDFCVSKTTVAECFVTGTPTDFSSGRVGYTDRGILGGSYTNIPGGYTPVVRYAYTQCPEGMVCSEGRCTDVPPAAGTTEHQERGILLPRIDSSTISSIMKTPDSRMGSVSRFPFLQAKKVEKYPTAGDVDQMFVRTQEREHETDAFVLEAFGVGQMPLNLMAGGKCMLKRVDSADLNAEGSSVDEARDSCLDVNNIKECYISYASGSLTGDIRFATYRCPEGTVCQYTRDGDRCEVPGERRDADGDGVSQADGDCDDRDATVSPRASDDQCGEGEAGFGIDNDCDGIIDDACEADESSATCGTRGLAYEGTAPGGQCCGDDAGETWNLFTSERSATNGCFQGTAIPVNGANPANLATGEWTRDREGTDVIGTAGFYPANDELVLTSSRTYTFIPAKQFHGRTMVWELEYKEEETPASLFVSVEGVHGRRSDDRTTRIEDTVMLRSRTWKKIRKEFDYDVGTAAEANGLLINIAKGALDATPRIRNFRVYPKDVEKVIYVDDQAYGCQAESTPVASQRYNNPPTPSSGVAIPSSNMRVACDVVTSSAGENFVCDNDGLWKETGYTMTQLRRGVWTALSPEGPEPDYEIVSKELGCCGDDSCWNGMGCTAPGVRIVDEGYALLCVAGAWQVEVLKKDQYDHERPTKACGANQCFWNNDPLDASGVEDECVDNGEFKEDFQCFVGSWRSRTGMLAEQMMHMTDTGTRPDRYTLFCDEPARAALADVLEGAPRSAIFGDETGNCGVGTGVPCVNNVCVLRFEQGGEEKVAVGMSLNKPINAAFADPGESILRFIPEAAPYAGEGYYSYCDGVINRASPGWIYYGCDGSDSTIEGMPTNLWYNPKTKSIIYSPQGITVGRESVGTRIADALLNPLDTLFGAIRGWLGFEEREGIEADRSEVAKRLRFDRIYIQRDGRQAIRGILQEDAAEPDRNLMTVEYENIPADVCTNLNRICVEGENCMCEPTIIQKRRLRSAPDLWKFMVRVRGEVGPAFADKWDDLTAKVRLDMSVRPSGPGPAAPSIGYMTPTISGLPVRFLIRDVPDEEDIIGYYWIFDTLDDEIVGKGARTRDAAADESTARHTFPADGTYDVLLNVINKNFAVEQARTTVTIPSSSGGVSEEELGRLLEESERERLCRDLGICPGITPLPGLGGP